MNVPCIDALTRPTLAVEMLCVTDDRWRMLRVTVVDGPAEQRLVVQGKLVPPWVAELESAWKQARQACDGRIVVDLSEMTLIDSSGQAALLLWLARARGLRPRVSTTNTWQRN